MRVVRCLAVLNLVENTKDVSVTLQSFVIVVEVMVVVVLGTREEQASVM